MGRLVEDLLLLARLDQHQSLDVADVDLPELAGDAVSDLRAVEPDRPVTLDARPPVVVEGDERRLRQVLANLLGNARVHTPAGTPVHVAVAVDDEGALARRRRRGPRHRCRPPPAIFERFYRADQSRSRASGGAGLGLSIVAGVVAAHGGRVEVDSQPNGGAPFTVRLPARQLTRPGFLAGSEPVPRVLPGRDGIVTMPDHHEKELPMEVKRSVAVLALAGSTLAGGVILGPASPLPRRTGRNSRPSEGGGPCRGPLGASTSKRLRAAIGIEVDALREALRNGQTIAEVAEANGVEVQAVVDALVADAIARIDEAVANGRLTQEEADEKKAELRSASPHV